MRRRFNIEGNCILKRHYMVKLDERLRVIKERYVDEGSYFVINRGRQYGKTTTLRLLAEYQQEDYGVLAIDFQKLDSEEFKDGDTSEDLQGCSPGLSEMQEWSGRTS